MTTVPKMTFKTRVRDESLPGENPFKWQEVSSTSLFSGKTIVLFALPGAFTPTCSSTHLPGYEKNYQEFKGKGVDEIYCLSVNDAFTMYQWGKHLNIEQVKLLPDGNGDFTRLMGMLVNKNNVGFGQRSWRYSMLVNDGVIEKLFSEAEIQDNVGSDPFAVSDAQTMLSYINSKQ